MVELEVPAIVPAVVERKFPAIVGTAAGYEDPAIESAVDEEVVVVVVAVVVYKVLLYDNEVAELEVRRHSVGLPVEEELLRK